MTGITARLYDLLDNEDVEFEIIRHPTDFRARRTAADTHTPIEAFANQVYAGH